MRREIGTIAEHGLGWVSEAIENFYDFADEVVLKDYVFGEVRILVIFGDFWVLINPNFCMVIVVKEDEFGVWSKVSKFFI